MKKRDKKNRSRHGSTSIFLAIIISALILVECTFLAFVWNLDYALAVNTALKTELDTILSDYNRQLFDCYGIYAFSIDDVDNYCFDKALEINGLDSRSVLYSTASYKITTEDLRKAISSYYWYRGSGVAVNTVIDDYGSFIKELDKTGIIDKISQYMQSPASGYVSQIIKGSESAEEWVKKAGELLNADDLIEQIDEIDTIRSTFSDVLHDSDIGLDVDITNWEGILDTLSKLEKVVDGASDASGNNVLSKLNISHYCAYNFDCAKPPVDDASINGPPFKSIHGDKKADCEYLITGLDETAAVLLTGMNVAHVLILANLLKDYANEQIRNTVEVIAEVISVIISAVSEGSVNIDSKWIALGLMLYVAMVQSIKDVYHVNKGEKVTIFEYDGVKMITFDYRDFLYLFCLCTPEEKLLERSLEILERDYGDLYKGISLEADFRGNEFTAEKSYQLYE